MKTKSKYYILDNTVYYKRCTKYDITVIYTLTFSGIEVLLESLNRAELLKAFPAC